MKRRTFITATSLASLSSMIFGCASSKKIPIRKGQVIACLGDSVTYGGHNGYVEMLQDIANKNYSDLNLTFINWGKSSETITGLTEVGHPGPRPYLFDRLDALLASTKVDIIMFCYGINCGIYGKPSPQLFDSYQKGVSAFLKKASQKNSKVILITPPPLALQAVPVNIDTTKAYTWLNPYPYYEEEVLQKFKEIILNFRHPNLLSSVDIHSPLLKNQNEYYEGDPIHPNKKGHQVIANTIIKHLSF